MANHKTSAQRYNDRMNKIWETARAQGVFDKKKWNEIRSGSRITLAEKQTLKSFNGEPREIEAGKYYITGFWGDMCGLNQKSSTGENEVCIQSRELTNFEEIIKE